MRIRSSQDLEREVPNPRTQPVNYVDSALVNKNESIHYALECNESKLQVDKEPVKNVSGKTT